MKLDIPYNGAFEKVRFLQNVDLLEPKIFPVLSSPETARKIEAGWEKVRTEFQGRKISVVVNDATRRVPNAEILRILLRYIEPERMEILIATGTHSAPSDAELGGILGEYKGVFNGRIIIHDCYDLENMVSLGRTSRGTPVSVNKRLIRAEALICVNSVEPHFFAGYTGGRKSLVPGLASFETVAANHSHAKSELADSLSLAGNPVHLDLLEAADMAAGMPIFSIQLILSRDRGIVDLYCGDLQDSFEKACLKAKEVYSVEFEREYDIVVAVGEPPLDANLYQLQKGQEHGARAVKEGGVLIVVGACREGAGSPYFIELADDYPNPADALSERAWHDNRFGIHKLIKTARRLQKIKIVYVTKLHDNIIRKLYFEPQSSVNDALREALNYLGDSCEIAVLKDACFLVPVRV